MCVARMWKQREEYGLMLQQTWSMKNERIFSRALAVSFRIIYVCDGLFKWLFEWKERAE